MGRHRLHSPPSFPPLISTSSCIEPSSSPFAWVTTFVYFSISLSSLFSCPGFGMEGKESWEELKVVGKKDVKEPQMRAWQKNKLYGHIWLVERRASRAEKGQPHHLVGKRQSFWNESLYTDKYFHVSVLPCGENVALSPFRTGSEAGWAHCIYSSAFRTHWTMPGSQHVSFILRE